MKWSEPTKEFTGFRKIVKPGEIDERLDSASVYLKELIRVTAHGVEENKKGFNKLIDKQDQMLDKQDQTINIIGDGNEKLSGKLDVIHNDLSVNLESFHQDTIQRFDIVDIKYGKISENMEKAINSINRTCDNTERLLEKSELDRQDFRDSMKNLTK